MTFDTFLRWTFFPWPGLDWFGPPPPGLPVMIMLIFNVDVASVVHLVQAVPSEPQDQEDTLGEGGV